jgi:putative ABC transport system permease protein
MARTFWPGESALGKILHTGDQDPAVLAETLGRVGSRDERWDPRYPAPVPLEVIGVVGDVRNTLRGEPVPAFYGPSAAGTRLFVRTSMEPAVTAEVLRREIEAVDPSEIEVTRFRTIGQVVAARSADSRFRALLVVLFAVVATGITCLGLFGVLTYAVAQRTREFGLRMALGADRPKIAGLVLNQGARMAGLGVAWGFVLVVWLTRYLSSLLFGVEPLDPTTLIGVSGLIFGLALLAMYLPARRAMRVDPITALRHE